MEQLPQELLKNVFSFFGDDQFLFVASVNQSFYTIYSSLFPKKQTKLLHVYSLEQVKLCYVDLIIRDKAPPSPQELIHQQRMISLATDQRPYILYQISLREELLNHCVKMGRLDWVQYLYQEACPWDEAACSTAAFHGRFEILQWLRSHGCPWDEYTCSRAALGGHLEILQWARQKHCPWDDKTAIAAALDGHLPVLQWAAASGCPGVNSHLFQYMAWQGHLSVMQWLRSYGILWHFDCTLAAAVKRRHFDVAKWAYENGCPSFCFQIGEYAAATGRLDILQWAHGNNFPLGKICTMAATQGQKMAQDWLWRNQWYIIPNDVPCQTYLKVLQFAHEIGCPWNATTCAIAAFSDDLLLLQYLHNNGCPWDHETCAHAAKAGNLKVLKYAHENGCPWDGATCANAAMHGLKIDLWHDNPDLFWNDVVKPVLVLDNKNMDCLRYALENGCPCDSNTCANAAVVNVELLQYAHESGCPWDSNVCYLAAFCGYQDVLKYAHEHGCPWGQDTFIIAEKMGHLEILQYIYDNNGPWDNAMMPILDDTEDACIDVLVDAHERGLIHVECPSLGPLPPFCRVQWDILHMHGPVDCVVFVCEQRVVRCFSYYRDLFSFSFIHEFMGQTNR